MSQKFLYILDYFVPQFQSEYGGLLNVIAENDEECFDIVVKWDNETWTEYYSKLRENIVKAQRFPLLGDEDSRVVESFTTWTMTHHVAHTNHMLSQMKQIYSDRIDSLKDEINKKQEEINQLKQQIDFLSKGKIYDC